MTSRIKIQDKAQLTLLKQVIDTFNYQLQEDINLQETINHLSKYVKEEEHKELIKEFLKLLPEKTFQTIAKRIKTQNNITLKYLEDIIEQEELKIKRDEYLFIKEEKDLDLQKKIQDKKDYFTKEIPKLEKKELENNNLFKEETKKFFNNFPIPPSSNQINLNVIKSNKEQGKSSFPIKMVVEHFVSKNEEEGNEYINNLNSLLYETNEIQNLLMKDYKNLEKSFQQNTKNINTFFNKNNDIENDLIKNDIIF